MATLNYSSKYCSLFCKENNILQLSDNTNFMPYQYGFNINNVDPSKTLFTLGIGINNSPHILTALQIVAISSLALRGYYTQIILGDYDVKLARNYNPSSTLLESYVSFCRDLCNSNNVVLQSELSNRLNCLVNISNFVDDNDLEFVREDILDYYNIKDTVSSKLSYLLIFCDLLSPILQKEYNTVIMRSGLDESKYAISANNILNRTEYDGNIGGLYTFIPNNGFNGYPQMSKSHPDSAIFLSDSRDDILSKFQTHPLKDQLIKSIDEIIVNSRLSLFTDISNDNSYDNSALSRILKLADIWKVHANSCIQ